MACEGPILSCVMNNPTVAIIGLAIGFAIGKAMSTRRRNSMMGGM